MLAINISTLKNGLSDILRKVRKGEEVLVLDRDHPVARLSAIRTALIDPEAPDRLLNLERDGLVTRAAKKRKSRDWLESHLIKVKGVSLVEALLREREESM